MVGACATRDLLYTGTDFTALKLQLPQPWLPLTFLSVLLHKVVVYSRDNSRGRQTPFLFLRVV